MSGLEKFQANEAWRTNFKKFLVMERKPEVVQNTLTVKESHRYSLDIGEDLKNIIEQKKNKKTVHFDEEIVSTAEFTTESNNHLQSKKNTLKETMSAKENLGDNANDKGCGKESMWHKTDEIFETSERLRQNTVTNANPNTTLSKYLNSEEEKDCKNTLVWQKTSDESFEALERMCDKTASDPNSTLFRYLHTDRKEQVLAEVKKRSADGIIDNKKEEELLMKINNCSFLDDVEAPSRMWENTIYGDTILQTSPVKMVGLLRPSTIMEEAPDDSTNSDLSSHMSFRTATKGAQSDMSSNTYETAHDSTGTSNQSDFSDKSRAKQRRVIDIDQILFTALDLNGQTQTDEVASLETEATIIGPNSLSNNDDGGTYIGSDVSVDLIDLEKTFGPLQCLKYPSAMEKSFCEDKKHQEIEIGENKLDDSIIEIMSDDEDKVENMQEIIDGDSNQNDKKCESSLNISDNNHETYSFNDPKENDKENCHAIREPSEKSMQFNDTMEEVEYMMKKGMEYMAAKAATKVTPEKSTTAALPKFHDNKYSKIRLNSPMKHTKKVNHVSSVPKGKLSTYVTPNKTTPISKTSSSASKRFNIDIRPFPKFDLQFLKPLPYAQTKDLTSKQQKFSHIVSPIGTYINKTAQTPLMSSRNCKTKNYFNSTAILELENESLLYKSQFANGTGALGLSKLVDFGSDTKRALPKKAYISSDVKHIVDERTPVTIPGCKKIQKYLENAMTPVVLRHEGKLKVGDSTSEKLDTLKLSSLGAHSKLPLKVSDTNCTDPKTILRAPHRNNASLADLSLMSGDISMYTIMDAQKF